MTRALKVISTGPGTTVQDKGRFGHIIRGAGPAGAADVIGLWEGAALLGQDANSAALEMAGMGGKFAVTEATRIALTGAPMAAKIDDATIPWNTSQILMPGQVLTLGHANAGNYAYLHVAGGIDTEPFMGSRSTHTIARMGSPVAPNDMLPIGTDTGDATNMKIRPIDRFGAGTVRIVPSAQTTRFSVNEIERLQSTTFARDPRGNRMGARMAFDGRPFQAEGQLNLVSEMVVPGDIQIAGDGTPFVLLGECQTTGGYPRIGTVIPSDIPRIAQARAGEDIRFQLIGREEGLAHLSTYRKSLNSISPEPLIRDPHDIADLLSYQLIDGVVSGEET